MSVLAHALALRRSMIGATELSVIAPEPGEPSVVSINRQADLATGRALAVLLSPGVVGSDLRMGIADRAARVHSGRVALCRHGDVLAVRTTVWVAVGGLEASYEDLAWALQDLVAKVRALGYRAETRPFTDLELRSPDAGLFRQRWPARPGGARGPTVPAPAVSGCVTNTNTVLYTAIAGGHDTLKRQSDVASAPAHRLAMVDADARLPGAERSGWTVRALPATSADPVRRAKHPKVLAHQHLPEARYSLWVDASVLLVAPFGLDRLIDLFLADADVCVFAHSRRTCVYEEARYCSDGRLDDPELIAAQMQRYERAGFPRGAGLVEASVILRRHTARVAEFNERWWDEIVRGSRRDQLSFPIAADASGVAWRCFPLSLTTQNGLFVRAVRSPDLSGCTDIGGSGSVPARESRSRRRPDR